MPNNLIICENCKKPGHSKSRCWAKGGGAKGQGPTYNRFGTPFGHSARLADAPAGEEFPVEAECDTLTVDDPVIANISVSSNSEWIFDTGAMRHICNSRHSFKNLKSIAPMVVQGFSNSIMIRAEGQGTVELPL